MILACAHRPEAGKVTLLLNPRHVAGGDPRPLYRMLQQPLGSPPTLLRVTSQVCAAAFLTAREADRPAFVALA